MFYADLPVFTDFSQVSDRRHYHRLPDDWVLLIADIEDSTAAIADGRYKDVNLIGAACITAILNIAERQQIPYVFGGDGATLVIPPQLSAAADHAMASVRQLARQRFSLSLRVGRVPVAAIHQAGVELLVAKFQLSPGNYLATFSGGGVALAERWIKHDQRWLLPPVAAAGIDLEGLSCRWEPLQSRNGVILSMLVHANADADAEAVYRQVINATGELMAEDRAHGRPVDAANLKLHWPPREIQAEIDATGGNRNRLLWSLRVYGNCLLQYLLDRFDLKAGSYDPGPYRQELQRNSDYRRFDDTLRVLFDCSAEQADQIESLLQHLHRQGALSYGLHRTDRALMTCIVFDLGQGEHVHFIDGADGGFAMAAKQLKSMAV